MCSLELLVNGNASKIQSIELALRELQLEFHQFQQTIGQERLQLYQKLEIESDAIVLDMGNRNAQTGNRNDGYVETEFVHQPDLKGIAFN